jgi:hypothetical protein
VLYIFLTACICPEPSVSLCASGDSTGLIFVWDMHRLTLLHRLSISEAVAYTNVNTSSNEMLDPLIQPDLLYLSPSIAPSRIYPITALTIYPQQGDILACSGTIFARWNVNGELMYCNRFFFCYCLLLLCYFINNNAVFFFFIFIFRLIHPSVTNRRDLIPTSDVPNSIVTSILLAPRGGNQQERMVITGHADGRIGMWEMVRRLGKVYCW